MLDHLLHHPQRTNIDRINTLGIASQDAYSTVTALNDSKEFEFTPQYWAYLADVLGWKLSPVVFYR